MTRPYYKSNTWTIEPGQSIVVARVADFLTCIDADAEFIIQIDNSPETEFAKGLTYSAEAEFSEVRIHNPSAVDITVKMGFGRGGIRDGRLILEGASIVTEEKRGVWAEIGTPIINGPKEEIILPVGTKKLWIKAQQYGPYPSERLLLYINNMATAFHILNVDDMIELSDVDQLHVQTFGNTIRALVAGFTYV